MYKNYFSKFLATPKVAKAETQSKKEKNEGIAVSCWQVLFVQTLISKDVFFQMLQVTAAF